MIAMPRLVTTCTVVVAVLYCYGIESAAAAAMGQDGAAEEAGGAGDGSASLGAMLDQALQDNY